MVEAAGAHEAKLVLLGETGVGKTSIALQYAQGRFSAQSNPTVGASFLSTTVTIDRRRLKLLIWDTAGQERFKSLAPMYYRGAAAALLVFDVADLSSFDKVQDWVNELQTNVFDDILICIVGNQIDKKYRKVDQKMAEDFAADIGALYFETSAKANIGIERMFLTISQEICRTLPENVVGPGSETGSQPFSLRASLIASRDGGQPGASQDSGCCLTS